MQKKLILVSLFGLLIHYQTSLLCLNTNQKTPHNKDAQYPKPASHIFIFDFHGVIADTNYAEAILMGIITLPFALGKLLYYILWKYPILGHLLKEKTIKSYPKKALIDAFAIPAACQKLRPEVVELINELKQSSHKVCLFSNLTPAALNILQKHHTEFFKLFDHIITTGPHTNPAWITKKNEDFYKVCDKTVNEAPTPHSPASIIFVDDKLNNGEHGRKRGWHFIHVTSAEQCVKAIKDYASAMK